MSDDDPADLVHDAFAQAVFGDTPLGRPDPRHRRARSRASSRTHDRRLLPPALPARRTWSSRPPATSTTPTVVRLVQQGVRHRRLPGDDLGGADPRRASAARRPAQARPGVARASAAAPSRPTSCSGVPGMTAHRRPALRPRRCSTRCSAAACRSRLFQEVREKRGLAYSVYSYNAQYADAGLFGVYAGCAPGEGRPGARRCARPSSRRSSSSGITDDELRRGQGQLRGALVLGLEDTGSRMSRIGKAELVYGELLGVDDLAGPDRGRRRSTTCARSPPTCLALPRTLAVIGPFDEDRDFSAARGLDGDCDAAVGRARCPWPDGRGGLPSRRGCG